MCWMRTVEGLTDVLDDDGFDLQHHGPSVEVAVSLQGASRQRRGGEESGAHVVLLGGKIVYFGECILPPVLCSGYSGGAFWVFGVEIEPPVTHDALMLTGQSAVVVEEVFDLGVDPAFKTVCCCR